MVITQKRLDGQDFAIQVMDDGSERYTVDCWIVNRDVFLAALAVASASDVAAVIEMPTGVMCDSPSARRTAAADMVKKALG